MQYSYSTCMYYIDLVCMRTTYFYYAGPAFGAVFWRGVTHVGGCNQKMWLYATLRNRPGRASRMARAGVRENAELENRVAKRC